MLIQQKIKDAIRRAPVSAEPFHEHDDCIRIAYEWLDAQKKLKNTTSGFRPLKHIIEEWGGRYVSQADVEVAAWLHPKIKGTYPYYNISARLILPSEHRLNDISEAFSQPNYRECFEAAEHYALSEQSIEGVTAKPMNDWEKSYALVLFNAAAFEAARVWTVEEPHLPADVVQSIRNLEPLNRVDRRDIRGGYVGPVQWKPDKSDFENCLRYFMAIRHNLIHGNKAMWPETSDRRNDLLEWAKSFVEAIYAGDNDYAQAARSAKERLNIENF
ncbi:hypothetical protein GCM10007094_32100 [Pseudovibrio japonicus]|uniref:Apea-like HEPN domain-containing protein n=1 Tax=Pseudovibrio japonicus TaxID=366534 RepID=A0ABQ3EHR7_9HYPH|nr:hypothetical protein [Pseudovibrio japonicus]GHB40353.1 hypothetical protein GCM10007094_32100 [Pseudovibrio japonicus]